MSHKLMSSHAAVTWQLRCCLPCLIFAGVMFTVWCLVGLGNSLQTGYSKGITARNQTIGISIYSAASIAGQNGTQHYGISKAKANRKICDNFTAALRGLASQ